MPRRNEPLRSDQRYIVYDREKNIAYPVHSEGFLEVLRERGDLEGKEVWKGCSTYSGG